MTTSPAQKIPPRTDADSALAALKRARKRAEELAAATGTAIVEWRDGKLIRIYPGRERIDAEGK
jgi:hypothetical protein